MLLRLREDQIEERWPNGRRKDVPKTKGDALEIFIAERLTQRM